MTYCVGVNLRQGLVFGSDSRTNAGIDQISRYCKMRVFETEGERLIATLSSGNLSITQNALNLIEYRSRKNPEAANFHRCTSMFQVATMLGDAMREVRQRDLESLRASHIDASASFIVGGQIAGEAPRLFLIYSDGNFIESGEETPYFQIGEIKYGKPILDRVIRFDTALPHAAKCVLVSFDSTHALQPLRRPADRLPGVRARQLPHPHQPAHRGKRCLSEGTGRVLERRPDRVA